MSLWKIVLVIFLLIGALIILRSYDYDLEQKDDRASFFKTYFGWLWDVGKTTKNVVTYAVNQDWLPESEDNSTVVYRVPE